MIKEKRVYRTRQRDVIESCIASLGGGHFTVSQVVDALEKSGKKVGQATVYRAVESLVAAGRVRKYIVDENSAACYQYEDGGAHGCKDHFHLKCSSCGRLIHVECEELGRIAEHMSKDHGFTVDRSKTVFYGVCEDCR